jgi:hypothetical protein
MFQWFTVIVNILPYDDHDIPMKLLHSLDRTVWGAKVEAILESGTYETLTVDELLSKLKSAEVDHGVMAKIDNPTDSIVSLWFLVRVLGLTRTHPLGCTLCPLF